MIKSKKGFTLVELLAVIIILAIIITIATLSVNKTVKKNRTKAFVSTMDVVAQSAKGILVGKELEGQGATELQAKLKEALSIDNNEYGISVEYDSVTKTYTITLEAIGSKFANIDFGNCEYNYECGTGTHGKTLKFQITDNGIAKSKKEWIEPENPEPENPEPENPEPENPEPENPEPPIIYPGIIASKQEFSCCPGNEESIFSQKYINSYDGKTYYCSKDFPDHSLGFCEGKNRLSNETTAKHASMVCTPNKANLNKFFSINDLIKGAGYGENNIKTFEDCEKNNICVRMDNMLRAFGPIGKNENIYGIKSKPSLNYGKEDEPIYSGGFTAPASGERYVENVGYTKSMSSSYSIILFDKTKIFKTKEGTEGFKELSLMFDISDDEWNRNIWNGMTYWKFESWKLKQKMAFSKSEKRDNVVVFKYKNDEVIQDIIKTSVSVDIGCAGYQ